MKPEHWQQLDELFHAALGQAQEDRLPFLDKACAGDIGLRKQVEALLAAHEQAGSFIESPAMEVAARELAANQLSSEQAMAAGETVSHYRIISALGSGGMGEVYLAQDTVLNRQVALKLLPENFTADRDRLRRFQQEAQAASALNHPNIITIHEIGQFNERHFIATEFIDGTTLRQNFFGPGKHTSAKLIREVLDIAIQTADALAAAHEAGIVHRDIKPENIMLRRRDGYVKVLDFGLAKLTEGAEVAVDLEGSTKALLNTSAGLVMGTASYMSPEQARGEKVDARTDIWSLGVVLYELVAGCAPFDRPTPSEVIALILEREPPPLTRYAREVPPELERIVSKALTKDKEERYQSAKDLLVDIRRLRQRLDIEAEIERAAELQKRNGDERAVATGAEKATVTAQPATVDTLSAARSTSTADYVASEIGRHKRGTAFLLGVFILAIAAGGYGIYRLAGRRDRPAAISFESAKKIRLTTSGKATRAAISPDGQFVMHVVRDAGQESLRLRQVATTSDKEIIAPAPVTYRNLTFTPDGNYVYYILESKDLPERALYQVSILGGEPKKLLVNLGPAPVTFSPDGKRFAFIRVEVGKESAVMIANADGSGERKLVTYHPPESCGPPAWSPDGKTIAYVMRNSDSNDMTVFEAQVANGSVKPLASKRWWKVQRMAWLSDGSGLLMIATDPQEFSQIWYLSYPEGESRRLTNDLIDYGDLTLTEDSRALATVPFEAKTNLWIAPEGDATRARQITFGVGQSEGRGGVSWAPDGRIVYDAVMGGVNDILIVDPDGKNQKQLTANARFNSYPAVTPDGRYIFFLSDRTGVPHIWRMDFDGSNQKQLTSGGGEQLPRCSPDGRWVVYSTVTQSASGKATALRVPSEGGEPVQLTDKLSHFPTVSPHGKLVAYVYKDEGAPWRIAIAPLEGGQPIKTFDVGEPRRLHWMPDGRAIAYVDTRNGVSNIFAQSLDGGAPKQVTDFKSDLIFSFDWSRDGKQLALSRGTVTNNVVMIRNFMSQH